MNRHITAATIAAAALLTACGGGGGDSAPAAASGSTSLSGVASKGPLKLAVVTAYKVDANGTVGAEIAHVTTSATDGSYTLDLGGYTGAVQLVVTTTSATLTADEASGTDVALPDGFTLHANTVVAGGSSSVIQSASITPYTELAHQIAQASGGPTAANIASATSVVYNLIGVDPVATKPLDPTVAPPGDATEAEKRYALLNAAISQLAASAPTTTDTATTQCFADAGSDAGKKIQCATQQIASAVTVTPGAQPAVNDKLLGLSAALVAAAADPAINKTGLPITADDAKAKELTSIETDVAANVPVSIPSAPVSDAQRSNIDKAKLFFSRLRANAAALQSGTTDLALGTAVDDFTTSLRTDVSVAGAKISDLLSLTRHASLLWNAAKSGGPFDQSSIPGLNGGCTVFQGDFPSQFGGATGAAGNPYAGNSTMATSADNAKWVGCSLNAGSFTGSNVQRRQTILFNMSAATFPGAIPYIAVARKRFTDGGTVYQQNLTPTLSGTAGYTLSGDQITAVSIVGDLPPALSTSATLLAARYPVNLAGSLTLRPSGAIQLALSGGSLGIVPVDATTASLTVDLSTGGASVFISPSDWSVAAQVSDATFNFAGSIKTPQGELAGSLLADTFSIDSAGEIDVAHLKFIGTASVTGAPSLLTGTIDVTDGATQVGSFVGALNLPNRPAATLTLSASRTTATGALSIAGTYVQDAVSVNILGTRDGSGTSASFSDSSLVAVSFSAASATSNVTVGGAPTAVIDRSRGRITYDDGTFETLL